MARPESKRNEIDESVSGKKRDFSTAGNGEDVKSTSASAVTISKGTKKAVVVGINDYMGTINDLPSCKNDAAGFESLLLNTLQFDEVRTLTDADATLASVGEGLDWLFRDATPDDRLVFFYSGHGDTRPRNGVLEEFLVLYDGLLSDDEISGRTQGLPNGIFTMVLDSCFSGGMEKQLFKAVVNPRLLAFNLFSPDAFGMLNASDSIEPAKIKAFQSDPLETKHFVDTQAISTQYKPFLKAPRLVMAGGLAKLMNPVSDEIVEVQMKGMLLSACLEGETAAASTSATAGFSAFTFALLRSVQSLGVAASTSSLIDQAAKMLHAMGFGQTAVVKEPKGMAGLAAKSFLNLPPISAPTAAKTQGNVSSLVEGIAGLISRAHSADTDEARLISAIASIIGGVVKSDRQTVTQPFGQAKLFGIDDAILIPAIASVVTAAIKGQQPTAGPGGQATLFGVDDAILIPAIASVVTAAIKGQQPTAGLGGQAKLFGVDDATLIPAIASVVTAAIKGQQPTAGLGGQAKLFGVDDAILIPVIASVVTAAIKGQQPAAGPGGQAKLFGVDDAILIPAIASVVTAAIKGQQPAAGPGGLAKLFGVDDAILIPAIASVVTAAIKGTQPAAGPGGQAKLFGVDDAILIPAIASVVTAAIKGQQPTAGLGGQAKL
ncbi:caspase family protein, partial [Caballeronia sp. GAWG2-1]|uniref:caspase family protein n=1 Tax=Caballeronia sp. GAWG2-1 TaxID=2921744 RepID=UPI002028B065